MTRDKNTICLTCLSVIDHRRIIEAGKRKAIHISSHISAPGEVTIRIKNPGVINDSDVTKVFDRYHIGAMGSDYRVQSSGIGLEIVKRILTLHNSNYGIELEDGKVCFYFTLYSELKLAELK